MDLTKEEIEESAELSHEMKEVMEHIIAEIDKAHVKKLEYLRERFKETKTLGGAFNASIIDMLLAPVDSRDSEILDS